jgi:hypothetical protein
LLTEFCLAAQRKFWNWPKSAKTVFYSAVQWKILEFVNKSNSYSLVLRAAKIFELRTKALFFVQPRSEELWNLPTRATQINCILFRRA